MNSKKEITYLTGIRGVAVLLILFAHTLPGHSYNKPFAYLGMSLFFMLSGVVLTYVWSSKFALAKTNPFDFFQTFISFMWSRFARLAPLYLLVGVAFFASSGETWDDVVLLIPRYLLGMQSWFYDTVTRDTVVIKQVLVYGISWSISSELCLYLFFPLLLMLLCGCRQWLRWSIAFLLYFVYCATLIFLVKTHIYSGKGYPPSQTFTDWFVYLSPYGRILEFMIGMLAGLLLINTTEKKPQIFTQSYHGLVAIALIVFIIVRMSKNEAAGLTTSTKALFQMGPIFTLPIGYLMIALARGNDVTEKLFCFRPLINIGIWSYSIYLLQLYGMPTFGMHWEPGVSEALRKLINFGFIFLLSAASYQYIETPARRLLLRYSPIKLFLPRTVSYRYD